MARRAATGPTFGEVAEAFLRSQTALGKAKSTVYQRQWALGYVSKCIGDDFPLAKITQQVMDAVMLQAGDLAVATRNGMFCTLRQFIRYAKANGHECNDFIFGYRATTAPRKQYEYIPAERFMDIVEAAVNPHARAIVATMLFTMLRGCDIRNLRMENIRWNEGPHGSMRITMQKTKKELVIPFSALYAEELRNWVTILTDELAANGRKIGRGTILFPRRSCDHTGAKGKLLDFDKAVSRFDKIFVRAAARAGIELPEGEGAHTARRSAARALYMHLVETSSHSRALQFVQYILGHASSKTTEMYIGVHELMVEATRVLADDPFGIEADRLKAVGGDNVTAVNFR
jgi:integrase